MHPSLAALQNQTLSAQAIREPVYFGHIYVLVPTMWTLSEPSSKVTHSPRPYRCYFMDQIGHILALAVVNCCDEASAMRQAATKFPDDIECCVIEVWEIGRRIARLERVAEL
jgi:hypothetical protein